MIFIIFITPLLVNVSLGTFSTNRLHCTGHSPKLSTSLFFVLRREGYSRWLWRLGRLRYTLGFEVYLATRLPCKIWDQHELEAD